jgi:L-amino acid N-acyltransferase YncA
MARRIRSVDVTDAHAVQRIYAPFVSEQATSFEVVVPDVAETERRIRAQSDRYPWLVFERDDVVIGYAYASSHRARQAYQWCADVCVYVDSRAHRCGVGRALYTALLHLLRRQGYINAYAGITLPNAASVGLHQSIGFVPVGVFSRVGFKFDTWHDVMWLHLRLAEAARPAGAPRPVAGVWQEDGVSSMMASCAESTRLG